LWRRIQAWTGEQRGNLFDWLERLLQKQSKMLPLHMAAIHKLSMFWLLLLGRPCFCLPDPGVTKEGSKTVFQFYCCMWLGTQRCGMFVSFLLLVLATIRLALLELLMHTAASIQINQGSVSFECQTIDDTTLQIRQDVEYGFLEVAGQLSFPRFRVVEVFVGD